MFTGIIESVGEILRIDDGIFTISHDFDEKLEIGQSIALSGMCATIIKIDNRQFSVKIIKISRDRTIFGVAKVGEKINLELPSRIGSRNSGHFVLGHIDEIGVILKREKIADFENFRIQISKKNENLIVEKGSIAVDGVSLTISNFGKNWFEVSIIPHTTKNTTFKNKFVGDVVNLEFDILGKYIFRKF